MKLAVLFIVVTCLQVNAAVYGQNITLSERNASLEDVFKKIEKQSGYLFWFENALLKQTKSVNIKVKNATIKQALDQCFIGQSLSYDIVDKFIVVKEAPITTVAPMAPLPIEIRGKITDEKGESLPGASVKVKGTEVATSTNVNGEFTLKGIEEKAVLIVTYLGFVTQEIPVNNQRNINIILKEDLQSLGEVVVVGYGTQKKESLTGSVATMTSEKLKVVPTANVATLMYGNLPGLIAVQRTGEPGADDPRISIRGNSGGALVVVDGITGRDFSRINPNEIESITILKDAASAAVYGVSGGNGVILVTTKKGKIGKPEFNYTLNYAAQRVTRFPEFVNAAQFAELKNEASVNTGGKIIYTNEQIEKYRQGTDPAYPNVNYYDLFVRDNTPQLQQDLTVRGGSESIKYFFLLGGINQESMWKGGGQDYTLYNFRSNVDAKINDDLDISVQLGARAEDRNNLVQDQFLMASWLQYQWPIYNPRTPDGKIANTNYGMVAYLDRDLTGYIKDQRNIFRSNISINYKLPFAKGLTANLTGSRDIWYQDQKDWRKSYGLYAYNTSTQTSTETTRREANTLQLKTINAKALSIRSSLNYTRSFAGKHNVSSLLLYEETRDTYNDVTANRVGYVLPIDQLLAGPDLGKSNAGTERENGRQNVVGRLNYDFKGKYLFEYSFGYNGSPKFPESKRWGYFPGYSAGWRVSEETFFKNRFKSVDNLKVRASFGVSGSDERGNFQHLAGYVPSQNYVLGNGAPTTGLLEVGAINPDFTWEESQTLNLGVDLGMWKGLFDMEVDLFHSKRKGFSAARVVSIPSTYGATLPLENLNSDDSKGFEVALRHSNKFGEFKYAVSPNISFVKSKWVELEQREFISQYDNWRSNSENRWKNRWNALKAVGQFQSEEEIKSWPIQDGKANTSLRPGDIKFDDFNKDGVINADDIQPIGRGDTPELNFGLWLNLDWRKFSMSMGWNASSNFNVQQLQNLIAPFNNDMSAYAYFMDRWRREDITNLNSKWIPGRFPSIQNNGAPNNNQASSFWIESGAYLRLKSLNISYNLESPLLRKYGMKNLMLTVSGQNLLTFSKLKYIDPETSSNVMQGGRGSYYPQQKVYNAGLNITF